MSKSVDAQKKTAAYLAGVAALMLSLSFAAVPFYDWFCRVTGYAGTTSVATAGADEILDRTLKIRFDASLEAGMPWTFRPMVPSMELRIGETGLAFYEAYNPTDKPVGGQASYNVTPDQSGGYFTKIECFCFTEQILQPGERVQMPVTFYVDPSIVDDPEASKIKEITLSYTFHVADIPEKQASLKDDPALADTATKAIE
ncbi:cytochrome c oxidase assembly protein CtaG [Cypionkella aquatica]|uniref:Cytochrome c oxidase assembly protein CtaG n=1 Tax=Cypionkella aquatica TaxID=1756042 RepID=A0AA37TWP4_9RHOB|nr:cytochrome c oxidase assembly protein [Cypionkella aquatica]GLS88903.1 cytochrome c oxidase assembly protein CtaG [Cypionkella aquatica]